MRAFSQRQSQAGRRASADGRGSDATHAPANHPARSELLGTRRAAGNQAVRRMLHADADRREGGRRRTAPPAVHEALRSSGQPLDADTRELMESRLGRDFGDVRVHTGALADESARSVDAAAFTVGRDIVFRSGAYAPQTAEGQRLLAHELTHVAQNPAGAAYPDSLEVAPADDYTETEAERVAQSAQDSGDAPRPAGGARPGFLRRQASDPNRNLPVPAPIPQAYPLTADPQRARCEEIRQRAARAWRRAQDRTEAVLQERSDLERILRDWRLGRPESWMDVRAGCNLLEERFEDMGCNEVLRNSRVAQNPRAVPFDVFREYLTCRVLRSDVDRCFRASESVSADDIRSRRPIPLADRLSLDIGYREVENRMRNIDEWVNRQMPLIIFSLNDEVLSLYCEGQRLIPQLTSPPARASCDLYCYVHPEECTTVNRTAPSGINYTEQMPPPNANRPPCDQVR